MATSVTMYRGDSRTLRVTVTSGGSPVDLTGYSIAFTVRPDEDADAVITKSSADPTEINITDAANGRLEIYLQPADTENLQLRSYDYDVEITSPTGVVSTVVVGTLTILKDITR